MKCVFIYNPVSGKGKISKKLDYINKKLRQKYSEVKILATERSGDMSRLARENADETDAIIFSGGDGSFNEILQEVAGMENAPELGYIPSGTVNDVARTLGISKNVKKALKTILTGKTVDLDCMKANDRYAMYVIAAGLFTRASYTTDQKQKNEIGKIAYFLEGAKKELKFDFFNLDLTVDEKPRRTNCVLISFMNGRSVAGFKLNKNADLQDGKIEVAVVEKKKKTKGIFAKIKALLSVCHLFLFGYRAKNKYLARFEGAAFDVDVGDDVVWNFDGEKGISGKIHVEVVPHSIKMIVPKRFNDRNGL